MGEVGAIAAIFIFIIGIYFAIPSEANIGYMVVDAIAKIPPIETNIIAQQEGMWKGTFNLLGVLMTIGDIVFIITQFKNGNY